MASAAESSKGVAKRERLRLNNNKAQKKYRQKKSRLKRNPKQEERQQIELEAQNLEKRVSKAEGDREELELQILQLKNRLRSKCPPNSSEMAVREEPLFVPSLEGYEGFRPHLRQKQGLLLRATFQPARSWTFSEAMRWSLKDFCEVRKEMVLRAGQLLLRNLERDIHSGEGQELKELMMEMQGLVGYLATHSPLIIWRSAECKGDTAEWPVDVPDRPFWIGILKQLRLSSSQEVSLLRLYSNLQPRLQGLLAQREEIRKALLCHGSDQGVADGASHDDQVAWHRLVRAARDNLDSWLIEVAKFHIMTGSLWGLNENVSDDEKGLDIFQDAQLLTLSWPYWPSKLMVADALREVRGAPPPSQLEEELGTLKLDEAVDEVPYEAVPLKMFVAYNEAKLKLAN